MSKINALIKQVDKHLLEKEKLKIVVPDRETLTFVEKILWGQPKESFRPHSINIPLLHQDLLLITLEAPSNDNYSIIFNLCQTPYISTFPVKLIYELEDVSHPQKAAVFRKKFQMYQKEGFTISSGI